MTDGCSNEKKQSQVQKQMTKDLNLKYSHLFDTDHIKNDVHKKSIRGGVANITSQGFTFGLTFIRVAILARLLTPDDYGVFGMVMVMASFAVIFKDIGLSTATIREKHITHSQVSNLFWINVLIGIVAMLIIIAVSPLIVWFYNEPRLLWVSVLISIAFFFAGLSVQHQAILKRQMRFDKIALVTIVSSVLSAVIGVLLAWQGFSYWSLVWTYISMNFFIFIGMWCFTGWLPSFPKKHVGTKVLLKVGLHVAGLNAFSTVTMYLDRIIVGRISNAETLGLYDRGKILPEMLTGRIRMALFSIALPALSSLQNDSKRFCNFYYKFLNMISWTTIPIAVFCFVFADECIPIFFGPQWKTSAFYMKFFAIKALVMPAVTSLDQVPLALGFSKRYMYAGMVRCFAAILCVSLGVYFYGITGAAIGVAVSDIIIFIPFFFMCTKDSDLSFLNYIKATSVPFLVSLLIGLSMILVKKPLEDQSVIYAIILMSSYFGITFICFVISDYFVIGSQLGLVKTLLNHIKNKRANA